MKSVVVLLFVVSLLSLALGQSSNCRSFSEFTLFPNPARVGQTVHLRAVLPLSVSQGGITGGTVTIKVSYNDADLITFNRLPLCNISSSIVCSSLGIGNNGINIDLPVPRIAPGTYKAVIETTLFPTQTTYCQTISLDVSDPDNSNKGFLSYFQASLLGAAQFANPNVLSRALGDLVQVGPVGPAPAVSSITFPWGTLLSVQGTEDNILPYTSVSNIVWGLYGNIVDISYSTTKRWHTYKGKFQVGYVSDLQKRTMDYTLLSGDFELLWQFDNSLNSALSGRLFFNESYGLLPQSWTAPITVTRFGYVNVTTNNNGVLMATAAKTYCPKGVDCSAATGSAVVNPNTGLSDRDIGLIVGLVVGVPAMLLIAIVVFFWRRHRRHYEEEQGIFSAVRKPEYGSALVVDDIIQETREQGSPELIPPLYRRDDDESRSDFSDEEYSDEESQLEDNRRSRFGGEGDRPRSRSPPPYRARSRSPAPRARSRSPQPRYSRSPPRHHARSRSPPRNHGRSRSPPRRNERSLSRPRDEESESYYSDAGSSASRVSSDEE